MQVYPNNLKREECETVWLDGGKVSRGSNGRGNLKIPMGGGKGRERWTTGSVGR